ncbi:MAG: hypothetical protein IJ092_04770 [Atopobiaceae bacterium]|nr:hypothetical protein [Atopobiaceae bacterium]
MLKVVLVALGLCLLEISVIVVASPLAKPALVLRFLPEDVRLAAQGHPEPPLWKQLIAHALLAGFLVAMLAGMLYVGREGLRDGCGFWGLTLRFIVLLYVMKAFDIIVQDQWLVMTVGYFKRLYPETAECAGWLDRGVTPRQERVRIVVSPFLCMLTAGLFVIFGM